MKLTLICLPLCLMAQSPDQVQPPEPISIRSVIEKALSNSGGKGEFESSAEYEKRLASALGNQREFRFVAESPLVAYDADLASWKVIVFSESIIVSTAGLVGRERHQGMKLARKEIGKKQYKATNSFGVSRDVTDTQEDRYGIIWDRSVFGANGIRLILPMPPSEAKEAKGHLKITLDCTLLAPSIYNSIHYSEATLDDPFKVWGNGYYLKVNVTGADIVNDKSGVLVRHFSD